MRRAKFYTIVGKTSPRIMAVTTEKAWHLHGRYVDQDVGTHCRREDTSGRFDKLEDAQRVVNQIRQIWTVHDAAVKPLKTQIGHLYSDAMSQISRVIQLGGGEVE